MAYQEEQTNGSHSYHQFTLKVKNRSDFIKHLDKNKIPYRIHNPKCIHEQLAFKQWSKELPYAEKLAQQSISLPIHHSLSQEHILYIINKIQSYNQ